MKRLFLSRFTPSLMPPEALEGIFVQRERLAEHTVELIRDSALGESKSHTLFIGPRGIGKTHLVSLIYYRLRAMNELQERLAIAWLREEEWGVASFLDLLLRILRALAEDDTLLAPRINALVREATPAAAERAARALLREIIGERTLLLIAENLDDLFAGLGDEGQKRLRSFLQETRFTTILATAQGLFSGVSRQTSPFYGFFRVQHLSGLTMEDAAQLLVNIAALEEDAALVSYLQTPAGRARVRALHHLAGGNPRVYVIFAEFLTREALDELVTPFLKMLDELTPYYQAKMRSLSAQQRKIVETLVEARGTLPVKEIALRCLISPQTVSGQLKELREKGYVTGHAIGREAFYELQEALMRLCLEVKKQRGDTIKLFVEFLRLWCSRDELERRLASLPPDAEFTANYIREAIRLSESDGNPLVIACLDAWAAAFREANHEKAVQIIDELIAIRNEPMDRASRGWHLAQLGRYEDALVAFDDALSCDVADTTMWHAWAWHNKGLAFGNIGRYEEALAAFEQALALDSGDGDTWRNKGLALSYLERYDEALIALEQALLVHPTDSDAWLSKGSALQQLQRNEEAIFAYEQATQIDGNDMRLWRNKALALACLERYEEALIALDYALSVDPSVAGVWQIKGDTLYKLGRHQEALEAFNQAIRLNNKEPTSRLSRLGVLLAIDRWPDAVVELEDVLSLFRYGARELYEFTSEAMYRIYSPSRSEWKEKTETFALLYQKHGSSRVLGQALASTIPVMASHLVSLEARQLWLETWQQAAGDIAEMQLPLRLLSTAVRYLNSGEPPDPRILLELPVEERRLLEPLLKAERDGASRPTGSAPSP